MKEEMRATRKAFRDVVKRAREEQRARRRVKRNRRRHGPAQADEKAKASAKDQLAALDGKLKNVSLDDSPAPPLAQPQPQRFPVRSETSSEFNRSNLHTPSSASQASVHETPAEVPDKKKGGTPSRIKDILKPRSKKRDEDKKKDGA
jgi:hypothetical protein